MPEVVITTSTGDEVTLETDYPALMTLLHKDMALTGTADDIINTLRKYFAQTQALMCLVLEFLPNAEISVDVNVSDTCKLRYKVQKL